MSGPLDIQGHRGARALFPENTLEGFIAAWALGVQAFELDVGMTADGVVVLSHDPALNPDITRDGSGAWLTGPGPLIWSLTHPGLCGYDVGRARPGSAISRLFPEQAARDGARIPTLAAVLSALPQARFTIEVKTDPAHPERTAPPHVLADATLSVIKAAGAVARVTVESFDWRVQHHVRKVCRQVALAWLTTAATVDDAATWWDGASSGGSVPANVAGQDGPTWAPDHTDLTEAQVKEAHALGLRVLPWTVNQPEDMLRLAAWGVDGLISDRPDLALRIIG